MPELSGPVWAAALRLGTVGSVTTYEVGPAALRPLMQTFWTAQGWRHQYQLPTGQDLAEAVAAGVMFAEPVHRSHDEWVSAARNAASRIELEEVSDAFVASLTTRRMDLRSALGSYAVARHLPEHSFVTSPGGHLCRICQLTKDVSPTELNVLNFERFKWGGVRHDNIRYVAFDLEQFQSAPRVRPDDDAVRLGRAVLDALRSSPANETAPATVKRLRMLKGNDSEREVVMDILGLCGVLATSEHPGYLTRFIPYSDRALPPHHFVDRAYPVCWWRGHDGVSDEAVPVLLPSLV